MNQNKYCVTMREIFASLFLPYVVYFYKRMFIFSRRLFWCASLALSTLYDFGPRGAEASTWD